MGRLIDADEYCAKHCVRNCSESQRSACSLGTIPTAYDVEDVVKQIEKLILPLYLCLPSDIVDDFKQKLIDIVRNGGVK